MQTIGKRKHYEYEDKETRKKVLHTQKMTQSRYFGVSGFLIQKYLLYDTQSDMLVPIPSLVDYKISPQPIPPVVNDQDVSLHPILPAVQLTTNLLVLLYFFLLVYFPLNKYYSILILSLLL